MAKAIHKPPARVRYDQGHPIVSCRLNRDTHTLLKQRLEERGVSFADFVKEQLGLQQAKMPDIEDIKVDAWVEGYVQAVEEYQIVFSCAVCKKPIELKPNSDAHKAMIGYMKEHGWRHGKCD